MKFSPDVLADIYLGKITNWNDARIAKDNPGAKLPNTEIFVGPSLGRQRHQLHLHRLSLQGERGLEEQVRAKAPRSSWPRGIGAKGNEGVAGMVRQTPGALGYVELIYALQNKIETGLVRNAAGIFMKATIDSVTAAAASSEADAGRLPRLDHQCARPGRLSDLQLHLAADSQSGSRCRKGQDDQGLSVLDAGSGEIEATALDYAPLPASVVAKVKGDDRQLK